MGGRPGKDVLATVFVSVTKFPIVSNLRKKRLILQGQFIMEEGGGEEWG